MYFSKFLLASICKACSIKKSISVFPKVFIVEKFRFKEYGSTKQNGSKVFPFPYGGIAFITFLTFIKTG
jgi:hypothetical protein